MIPTFGYETSWGIVANKSEEQTNRMEKYKQQRQENRAMWVGISNMLDASSAQALQRTPGLVHGGVPGLFRPKVYSILSGAMQSKQQGTGVFAHLLKKLGQNYICDKDANQIQRDVGRTLGTSAYFPFSRVYACV
jgi:hypothetical protein